MPLKVNFSMLLAALLLVLTARTARADHYSGASISYECIGGNFFVVTLVFLLLRHTAHCAKFELRQ